MGRLIALQRTEQEGGGEVVDQVVGAVHIPHGIGAGPEVTEIDQPRCIGTLNTEKTVIGPLKNYPRFWMCSRGCRRRRVGRVDLRYLRYGPESRTSTLWEW